MQNDIQLYKNSKFLSLISLLFAFCSLLRYRFFLFAGIFPFLLGQAIAFDVQKSLDWQYFWLGFLGIFLVLVGVELFNEYFDAKEGGDRIFIEERPNIPDYFLLLALCSMLFAFFIGLYLSFQIGWPILLFSLLGFLSAYFYVGPPIKWAYRGLGELVIAISYGPLMVLGSYFLQAKRVDELPILVSLILGLLIFSLAIINEIPDYFQDRLVGKKNLVVRLGRKNAAMLFTLSLIAAFVLLSFLTVWVLLWLPLVLKAIKIAQSYYDQPEYFLPAIRITILTYISIALFLFLSHIIRA